MMFSLYTCVCFERSQKYKFCNKYVKDPVQKT